MILDTKIRTINALASLPTSDSNAIDAFAILQCKPSSDRTFLNYEKIHKNANLNDYNLINYYKTTDESRHKPVNRFLEDVFYAFNMSHPDDFVGHSLSVSDIVAIKRNNTVEFYFTDTIGFVHLPEDATIQ